MRFLKHFLGYAALFFCLQGEVAWAQAWGWDYRFIGDEGDVVLFHEGPAAAGLSQEVVGAAARAALNAWGSAGSRLKFQLLEISSFRELNDLHSVLPIFVTRKDDPLYRYAGFDPWKYSIAVPRYAAGVLKTCDIVLNAADFLWSTLPPSEEVPNELRPMDLQSVLIHDIGHCLGLENRTYWNETGSVMYAWLGKGEWRRQLDILDRTALQSLYPLRGAGARCDTAEDCASGMLCIVQAVHKPGVMRGYCAPSCPLGVGALCPMPMQCKEFGTSPGQGRCLLPNLPDTPVGEACPSPSCSTLSNARCLTNTQLNWTWPGGYCSQECNTQECPEGSICAAISGDNTCLKSCAVRGNDCRTGYVCYPNISEDEGVCLAQCVRGGCAAGYVCREWDGRCMPQQNTSARIGDVCLEDEDCSTGQKCWQLPSLSKKLCTARCRPGEPPCPSGSACVSLGEGEMLCLNRCESRARCFESLQCALVDQGKACVPPCNAVEECPVGSTRCEQGQCLGPEREEENPLEGGIQLGELKPNEPSALPGNSSSGCGCDVAGTSQGLLWGLCLMLMMGLRFRRKGF